MNNLTHGAQAALNVLERVQLGLQRVADGNGSEALLPTIAAQLRDALKIVEMTAAETPDAPRYLMNPPTGTVQAADDWAADGYSADEHGLIEVASLNGKHWHALDDLCVMMDDELRERLHSQKIWISDQTFLDAYAAAHAAKFGEEFSYE